MIVNYPTIFLILFPFLLLAILFPLKERYQLENKLLRTHDWSLIPGIIAAGLYSVGHITLSIWNTIPILRIFKCNLFNWNLATSIWIICILTLISIYFQYGRRVSIIQTFNLRYNYLPFIFKLCGVLSVVIFLIYYFSDFSPSFTQREFKIDRLKSIDAKNVVLDFLVGIILGPSIEEFIYRGLIYPPLYRKVGRFMAVVLSSLIWTSGHFESLVSWVGIFLIGIMLAWLYDRNGSLIHPIVFHMFRNSWIFIYYLAEVLK